MEEGEGGEGYINHTLDSRCICAACIYGDTEVEPLRVVVSLEVRSHHEIILVLSDLNRPPQISRLKARLED